MVTAVYGEAMRALDGLDAEVLVTIGPGADPAVVGTPPSNVRIERRVDQNQVLVHSALDHGASWSEICGVLGVSRQAAFQRSDPSKGFATSLGRSKPEP